RTPKQYLASAMPPPTTPPHHVKILMLHGFTQSGSVFHAKTKALEKSLSKAFAPTGGISLHYPTAPCEIKPADLDLIANYQVADKEAQEHSDSWGWWLRKGDKEEECVYTRMEEGFARMAEWLRREGPFDGVVGFSQGGCAAGMIASLLEEGRRKAFDDAEKTKGMPFPASLIQDQAGRQDADADDLAGSEREDGVIHPPLRFAVSYSGFKAAANPMYDAFYEPKIKTPMLHFIGSVDTVVEEKRSTRLVDRCVEGKGKDGRRLVYHPGGHFLPNSKQFVAVLVAFIKEAMGWDEDVEQEKKAEDMDMPF
ncbi:MAG: hypothetical protein M1828_002667, partial [Chrysothrix sp. TS-e1954]